jgi:hypothetical protein
MNTWNFAKKLLLISALVAPVTCFAYTDSPFACNPEWGSGDAHICHLEHYRRKKTMPEKESDKILQKCIADISPPPCEKKPPAPTCDPAKDEVCDEDEALQS